MNSLTPIKKIRKEPYIESCAVKYSQHCAMDIALEELYYINDVNVLVIGVGECVYYSRKLFFDGVKHNWAFQLTDNELVFGDTTKIGEALEEITQNGLFTICILTCVPSIMNLEIESEIEKFSNVILLKAPDFVGISSYDILSDLYSEIAKKCKISINNKVVIWEGNVESIKKFTDKLQASIHIVNDRRYLDALNEISKYTDIKVIDNTALHNLDFYTENSTLLGISKEDINYLKNIIKAVNAKYKNIAIKCARAYDLAEFMKEEGFIIDSVIFQDWNKYSCNKCLSISRDLPVAFSYEVQLVTEGLSIDLSFFDEEIYQKLGFERLKFMLEKVVDLCR